MYILSAPNLTWSARLLAAKLSELRPDTVWQVLTQPSKTGDELKIRWGTSIATITGDTEYNSPQLIRMAGNKESFSESMRQANILHVELQQGTPERYPVVVRTELNRGGGLGIVFVENAEQFQQYSRFPWSYFYNFSTEVGVHMLGGEVRKIFKKVREDGLEDEKYPRRNTNNGYRFSLIKEPWPKLLQFCNQFYRAFPIQMGRADIGWDSQARAWRIIEFNSAPDLTQNSKTLEMYATFLAEKI